MSAPAVAPTELEGLASGKIDGLEGFDVPEPEDELDDSSFVKPDHTASRTRILPPRRGRSTPREKKKVPRSRKGQFVEPLTALYGGIGAMLHPVDPVCSQAIMENAEQCAVSLDELAYQNDAVRRALIALTQTSAVGMVIVAHLPIIMSIATHHGPGAVKNTPEKNDRSE